MAEIKISGERIELEELKIHIIKWLDSLEPHPKRLLILPPDITRIHSKAGFVTKVIYEYLSPECEVDIMPALGTHFPMSSAEREHMFSDSIPAERFFDHDWHRGVKSIGKIPSSLIRELSGGQLDYEINVEINRRILEGGYDHIISIGQVVPHEVVGMSNQNKNIFVGCGGKDMIDKSHFLGAVYGIEKILGRADTPVRRLFNYAEDELLPKLPIHYFLTVTKQEGSETVLRGVFAGKGRKLYKQAAELSCRLNITLLDKPLKKVVVYLDPEEYKSTWLGDKAIYRTRMAIEDGGDLMIIAPGIKQFGEDETIDELTKKYGYAGTEKTLQAVRDNKEMRDNLCVAASIIHGAADGRFKVTFGIKSISSKVMQMAHLNSVPAEQMLGKYPPDKLKDGFNTMPDGESIFYISNPALGLWALRDKFLSN